MFLLFRLIRAPSTTSSAGRSALRLPALVLDDLIYTERGRWCSDLNTKAGRRRIQEKVSLLNKCWQLQTPKSGQFDSPLNGTGCHWAYTAAIATESQMRWWSKLEINSTFVKFIFANEVTREVFVVQNYLTVLVLRCAISPWNTTTNYMRHGHVVAFLWKDAEKDKIGKHLQWVNVENHAVKPRTVGNNRK